MPDEVIEHLQKENYRLWDLIENGKPVKELKAKIQDVLGIALAYGGIDGDHHKTWVIDQMVRGLTGEDYEKFVSKACRGEDGPDTYKWDTGIAP